TGGAQQECNLPDERVDVVGLQRERTVDLGVEAADLREAAEARAGELEASADGAEQCEVRDGIAIVGGDGALGDIGGPPEERVPFRWRSRVGRQAGRECVARFVAAAQSVASGYGRKRECDRRDGETDGESGRTQDSVA